MNNDSNPKGKKKRKKEHSQQIILQLNAITIFSFFFFLVKAVGKDRVLKCGKPGRGVNKGLEVLHS